MSVNRLAFASNGINMYERWLLERVLVHCWTVSKCAKWINYPEPQIIQGDFDRLIGATANKG